MRKFKVGDRVRCLNVGSSQCLKKGDIYTITELCYTSSLRLKEVAIRPHSYDESNFELAWQPTPGEMIEVSHYADNFELPPSTQKFFAMDGEKFVCHYRHGNLYESWLCARPIKTTHTITDSHGLIAEISEGLHIELFS